MNLPQRSTPAVFIDLEEQYDKIYRYCYYKLHHREKAEDITQEAFLRFLENEHYQDTGKGLQYLYTIARNLCIDEFRRKPTEELPPDLPESPENKLENQLLESICLKNALTKLSEEDQELLLLKYVNEVPTATICQIYSISRFTLYRRAAKALSWLKEVLSDKEDNCRIFH